MPLQAVSQRRPLHSMSTPVLSVHASTATIHRLFQQSGVRSATFPGDVAWSTLSRSKRGWPWKPIGRGSISSSCNATPPGSWIASTFPPARINWSNIKKDYDQAAKSWRSVCSLWAISLASLPSAAPQESQSYTPPTLSLVGFAG